MWPVVDENDWCGEHPGRTLQMTACLSSTQDVDLDAIAERVLDLLRTEGES